MRDRKAAGVDAIEILNDDVSWSIKAARIPLMKPDVLSAIIDEAHRQGLKVFAHAPMLEAAKQVLRVLQPPRFYDAFTSPIGVKQFEFFFNNADFTKQHLPVQRANLKAVFDAGVPVVLGTDTGFFGVLIGVATQIEPERIGRSRAETGRCDPCRNTRRGANAREEQDLGSVEAGKVSMLDADPRTDIRNVARIYRTFKAGVAYEPVDSARPIR